MARTGIGIAVRKGAPKPDVSSAAALRRALLAAKSIGHTAPAGGGVTAAHIMGVFEKLGIAAEVTPKVKLAAGGPNGRVSVPDTAQRFEASFLSVMLQQAFEGVGDASAPFGGGPGEAMFKSFLTEEMAKQTTRAGGIGVAAQVEREMLKMQGLT